MRDMKVQDLSIGMIFGKWVTTSYAACRLEDRTKAEVGKRVRAYTECQCNCGTKKMVRLSLLSSGESNGCGCGSKTALDKKFYQTASDAYNRCYNPNYHGYDRYGGRGIEVLFASRLEFADYIKELPGYEKGKSLDRIDNDGNYERGNLRWATASEQNINQGMKVTNTSGIKYLSRRTKDRGWLVQFQREAHRVYKWFSDRQFGSEDASKQAAIFFIEEQLERRNQPD
jgi:hypothetical protein